MLVSNNLRLDMTRPIEETFQKTLAAAEGDGRLAHGGFIELCDLFHLPRDFQAASTAAMGRLDGDGQAVLFGKGGDFGGGRNGAIAAGNQRCANTGGDAPRHDLVAQCLDDIRVGTDPDQSGIDDSLGKFGAFDRKP